MAMHLDYNARSRGFHCDATVTLVVALVSVFIVLVSASQPRKFSFSSDYSESREGVTEAAIAKHVRLTNSQSVQDYTLSDGDAVSCIRIEDQLSLQSGNVPLQMKPNVEPKPGRSTSSASGFTSSELATQLFATEIGSCPDGTIPVRNLHTATATSLDALITKKSIRKQSSSEPPETGRTVHEHAYASLYGDGFKGTEVLINVWNPYVQNGSEFSLAQLWVISDSTIQNTAEAGWQVFQYLYGDFNTRLFVYWTADTYKSTGCYNLGCSGFVQVSSKVLLGGTIAPISKTNSIQYEMKLRVFQDSSNNNWWLQLNDEYVGYWPSSIYTLLKNQATLLEWGGEVYEVEDGTQHSHTDMGSGEFPSKGYMMAAYQRNVQYIDADYNTNDATRFSIGAEASSCYAPLSGVGSDGDAYFYFGGPGYNPNCTQAP